MQHFRRRPTRLLGAHPALWLALGAALAASCRAESLPRTELLMQVRFAMAEAVKAAAP